MSVSAGIKPLYGSPRPDARHSQMPESEFRPEQLFRVLEEQGVRSILIGGFAAVIHGSPYVTTDVDIVPEITTENLERLSAALHAVHAKVWTASEPEGVPFDDDSASLGSVDVWNLVTDFGRLDITLRPSGTDGYADVARDAVRLTILGTSVNVASLADIVRSKEAADRDKDRLVLPVLRRILEEQEGGNER
jgi:hypothetical protein